LLSITQCTPHSKPDGNLVHNKNKNRLKYTYLHMYICNSGFKTRMGDVERGWMNILQKQTKEGNFYGF
jgi:hypothetical protein